MSLLELVFSILLVVSVIFCSKGLGHIVGIPEAAAVVPIIGVPVLLLHVTKRVPGRALMILSTRLLVVALLAIGIAPLAGLREATFVASGTAVFVFILIAAIQSKVSTWRRGRESNASQPK